MSERYGVDDFNTVPARGDIPELALSVEAFIADKTHTAPPLLGTEDEAILPTGGLAIVAGQAGVGKTTLVLDLLFHLVSGKTWLAGEREIAVARPLSVLLIENEGPREQFRRKLASKHDRWQADLAGTLWIQTWRWGAFSLADMEAAVHLGGFCEDNDVDLIVGDPLGTFGSAGGGKPDETRDFINRLHALGLAEKRAFLFLHHFRKDKASDEIDQLSGAWGPHLDSLMIVKPSRRDQVRLSFPKLRWAAEPRKPMILNRVRAPQTFEFDHEEGDQRALVPEIIEFLERDREKGVTAPEVSTGIGSNKAEVLGVLKGNEHLFRSYTGEAAKERGRSRTAVVWELVSEHENTGNTSSNGRPAGAGGEVPSPLSPVGRTEEPPLPATLDDGLDWR